MDIVYRKPCFAGQTMRIVQRAFEAEGRLGIVASLVEGPDDMSALRATRPNASVRMTFA
jgi:hypothetical protein